MLGRGALRFGRRRDSDCNSRPDDGPSSWFGEQYLRAAEMAVDDLNARGGVLGQRVELIVGDDFCDPDQAVAVARKLASEECCLCRRAFLLTLLDRRRKGL